MSKLAVAVLTVWLALGAAAFAQIGPYTPTMAPQSNVIAQQAPAVSVITVGGSPFTYTNSTNASQNVVVSGGTTTALSFARLGTTVALCTGGTNCAASTLVAPEFELAPGDALTVTYSVAPTMTAIPIAPAGR